jgi:hypothetical protein
MNGIDRLVKENPLKIFAPVLKKNYPKEANVGTIHGSSGIVAFSRGSVGAVVKKHWQKGA